ncbi:MAG: glycosyltransferase [Flavobacteriales bacterium]|nr:glycosyltransferase [Flavobacteriales bacterium]
MKTKKRILVAPLDWGIGHATRCIPIIKELINQNYEVIIAADERPMHLLSNEFPKLEIIRFSGYNIKYPTYLPMSISILLKIPRILWNIKKENTLLNQIIRDYKIDGVISDNRFGLYTKKVPCVFITHQLQIQSPYFIKEIRELNYKYINRFDVCWVIDDEKNNLAGKLSKPEKLPKNTIYIGNQSRFEYQKTEKKYDFLGIVSGPEPQRTILEKGLIKALKDRNEKSLIVLGKPEFDNTKEIGNLTIKSHLNAKDLNKIILSSELIICRPGYSTIMDLKKLGSKAFFIPTPGQTEQEYLAQKLSEKKICYFQKQKEFNFEKGLKECKNYSGFKKLNHDSINWGELLNVF